MDSKEFYPLIVEESNIWKTSLMYWLNTAPGGRSWKMHSPGVGSVLQSSVSWKCIQAIVQFQNTNKPGGDRILPS